MVCIVCSHKDMSTDRGRKKCYETHEKMARDRHAVMPAADAEADRMRG